MDQNNTTDLSEIRVLQSSDNLDDALAAMPPAVGLVFVMLPQGMRVFWRVATDAPEWLERHFPKAADVKMRRGDTPSLVDIGGESVVGVDMLGRLIAKLHPTTVAGLIDELPQYVPVLEPDPIKLGRGDSASLVQIGDETVMGVDAAGQVNLCLADSVVDDIAARINMAGGRPGPAELIPDFDAWNVREDGDIIYFNAHIYGDSPREYLRYGSSDPWANAHSETLLRLLFGDEFTDTSPLAGPDHEAHILTFNDDAGQAGLNGEDRLRDATDIQRSGRGFAATASDTYLKNCRGPKHWHGVRSETVMGAELAELTQGQGLTNLVDTVDQFRSALAPYGRYPAVNTVSILQGATEDSSDYHAQLLTLCSEISQQMGARQINCYQPVGDAFKGDYASVLQTPLAFVERGALPIVLVSPVYWCERRAGSLVQITSESMTMLAELDGLATKDWLPPLAFLAERDGRTVTVDFEVMAGHALVSPTRGLSLVSDNDVDIDGWEIVPDPTTGDMTRLHIELTDVPVNGSIRYAYNNIEASFDLSGSLFCSGGDLRDDWSAPSVTGKTLHRYAFSFEFKI